MTEQEMMAQIEQLKAENAALKARPAQKLSLKVSTKGACSLYGMGRWPVTLYPDQWRRVLRAKDEIEAFLTAHASEFSEKE